MKAKPSAHLDRRLFLRGVTVAGLAAAASACSDDDEPTPQPPPTPNKDVEQLNALLSAEYKAIDAYAQGAAVLTDQKDNGPTQEARDLAALVLAVAVEFRNDHQAHAALLEKTVRDLQGTPVSQADSKFTLPAGFKPSTLNVMKLAANAERSAAIAYNGVIRELSAANLRFLGSAIEGDETQHFMVLYALIEGLAVPTASLSPTMNADQVVPRAFVSSTASLGGGEGLQSETDLRINDNG
jgi:hypothetical protein